MELSTQDRDRILLHWSGELDAGETHVVERLLVERKEASAYLRTLRQLEAAGTPRVESRVTRFPFAAAAALLCILAGAMLFGLFRTNRTPAVRRSTEVVTHDAIMNRLSALRRDAARIGPAQPALRGAAQPAELKRIRERLQDLRDAWPLQATHNEHEHHEHAGGTA